MFELDALLTMDALIAFTTLTFLEIVLGIDNIIFISILSNKLPDNQRKRARTLGILAALVFRIAMLFGISWIIQLTSPIWESGPAIINEISGRDLVLITGGLFLLAKSTKEIHKKVRTEEDHSSEGKASVASSMASVVLQIALLDVVFSFDSILTAIGMTDLDSNPSHILIIIAAIVISLLVMLTFAKRIADFIEKHVSLQILALSFLILIGTVLVTEGFDIEVPKGYIYFAVAYSFVVELVNMRADRKKAKKAVKS
ncbi:MAG: TerC family protein [Flavobacteriia bacterium]|nr:TerC family protein [Flavobacteriia bacterium]